MLLPCGNAYLRKLSVESVQSVFVLPAEFFSNTDYKDVHGCYCFEKIIRSIRTIRVRKKISVRKTVPDIRSIRTIRVQKNKYVV